MSLSKKRKLKLEKLKEQVKKQCKKCLGEGCQVCGIKINEYFKIACANIPLKFWESELDDLDSVVVGKDEIIKYIDNIDDTFENGIGLYLCGQNGVGKSLSAALIMKAAIRKGYTAKYITLNEVIGSYGDGLYDIEAREEFKKEILDVDFLILDDVDKTYLSKKSTYAESILDSVFRYRANENYPVIVTANKTREDLLADNDEVYAISLLSLLNESMLDICFMADEDRRERIKEELRDKYFGSDEDES